jgi:4-amino-4-deoxy-L-arabinose transferase-like glycosyltransferase
MFNLKSSFPYIYLSNKYLQVLPYISLLIWVLPLLLFSSGHNSLMAHDEGLYAGRARLMLDSGDWIHPWSSPHHKTPGFYWLIVSVYKLFGINETSVRLPSLILGIFSTFILYEISKILINEKIAWLAAAILNVEFLWLQYCRLGTPDVSMVFLVLLGILSLLKAELYSQQRSIWCFLCGFCFGYGFIIRSFMIILPIGALFPYLILENRRHRFLSSPSLYLGLIFGLIPSFIWVYLSSIHYGNSSFTELFEFVLRLGSKERGSNGILFYLWNVSAKSFPWCLFAILGLFIAIYHPKIKHKLIVIGFPIFLFAELSIFSTRLSHYSLCLYPFIALLAAIALDTLTKIFIYVDILNRKELLLQNIPLTKVKFPEYLQKFPRYLSFGFGGIGIVLILGVIILIIANHEISKYATLILVVGVGWLTLPIVWMGRRIINKNHKSLTASYWLAGCLLPVWLSLAVAGCSGFFSDYNPDFRSFVQHKAIAQVLQSSPVNFVDVGGKPEVLMRFYTKKIADKVDSLDKLTANSYAWIPSRTALNSPIPHRVIGTVQKYSLVQVGASNRSGGTPNLR